MQISCNLKKKKVKHLHRCCIDMQCVHIYTHCMYSIAVYLRILLYPADMHKDLFFFLIIWCFLTIILLLHLLSLPHLKEKFRTQIQTGHHTVVSL